VNLFRPSSVAPIASGAEDGDFALRIYQVFLVIVISSEAQRSREIYRKKSLRGGHIVADVAISKTVSPQACPGGGYTCPNNPWQNNKTTPILVTKRSGIRNRRVCTARLNSPKSAHQEHLDSRDKNNAIRYKKLSEPALKHGCRGRGAGEPHR